MEIFVKRDGSSRVSGDVGVGQGQGQGSREENRNQNFSVDFLYFELRKVRSVRSTIIFWIFIYL